MRVTYKPWEGIVIHEAIQYSLENLIAIRSMGAQTGGLGKHLLWAEGVAFHHVGMESTRVVVMEKSEGRLHWSSVSWSLMPEFKSFIEISETKVRIPIVDVSSNKILSDAAKWLKGSAET